MIILYTTGCPRCHVLESKLLQKHLDYIRCEDVEEMERKGITSVPCLEIEKKIYEFGQAVKILNKMEG